MATKQERAALREKYCLDQLTPVLQPMVMELLKVLPDDPEEYMRTWLDAKIVEEGGVPPHSDPITFAAVSAAPPPPAETRPSVGTPIEIVGEVLPEEEATRLSTLTQLIADTPGATRATMFTVRGTVASVADKTAIERLSSLSQVIADTPGAARGTVATVAGSVNKSVIQDASEEPCDTVVTVRGTLVPADEVQRLSTLSQVLAQSPGSLPRGTVVTVRATVTASEAKKLSTLSQVLADTPGASRATVQTVAGSIAPPKAGSTLSALIADTPGANRATVATVHSAAPLVAVRGTVVSDVGSVAVVQGAAPPPAEGTEVVILGAVVQESQIVAEQNRMSTLTQLLSDTPGASRGTLMTVRGSVTPATPTPQENHRLSQFMSANPNAARGTVVTIRGTVKSRPSQVITAQVVIPDAEAQRLSAGQKISVTGTIVTPAEASRASNLGSEAALKDAMSVLGGLGGSSERGSKLSSLDKHEEERKTSQRRVSEASKAEQLRLISELEHAEHDAKEERKSNRQSAAVAMNDEQAARVSEHGSTVRKVSSAKLIEATNNA